VSAHPSDQTATIIFDGAETLIIHEPQRWSLDNGLLYVGDADILRFQWFYYGKLPSADSLQFIEYRRVGDKIESSSDFEPKGFRSVDRSKPAVQLHDGIQNG
jgi:hypothetical protein